eukprot:1393676-Amorphochlora_amoeboformis.AAC.2
MSPKSYLSVSNTRGTSGLRRKADHSHPPTSMASFFLRSRFSKTTLRLFQALPRRFKKCFYLSAGVALAGGAVAQLGWSEALAEAMKGK